jgi:hypothetical protein
MVFYSREGEAKGEKLAGQAKGLPGKVFERL